MRRWKILYFDDDINQIEALKDLLADRFNVSGTDDVSSFERYLDANPDLILIDIHMPLINGYELFYKITQSPMYNGCPMMFISGDPSPENRLKSFQVGADDFLSRDLEISELAARIVNKIKLHRSTTLKITVSNLTLDLEMFCVYINDKMISLTLNELKVLGVILRNYPKACSRGLVMEKVWGAEAIKPSTVNAHMSSLNSKLREWSHELRSKKDQVFVLPKTNCLT